MDLPSVAVLTLTVEDRGPYPIELNACIQMLYSINFFKSVKVIWLPLFFVFAVKVLDSKHHGGMSSGHFTI